SQSKVEDFDVAVPPPQHNIFRLNIAVNHVCFMGRGQCISGLYRDVQRFKQGQRRSRLTPSAAKGALSQGFSVNKFKSNEMPVVDLADLIDGDDVWMIE